MVDIWVVFGRKFSRFNETLNATILKEVVNHCLEMDQDKTIVTKTIGR